MRKEMQACFEYLLGYSKPRSRGKNNLKLEVALVQLAERTTEISYSYKG